ncbi:MAG: hypothetical protein LBV23_03980 [Deltaproteobacteria bacterium]|nr:hypothetical protein [Deltaproteobacteria bacterium]
MLRDGRKTDFLRQIGQASGRDSDRVVVFKRELITVAGRAFNTEQVMEAGKGEIVAMSIKLYSLMTTDMTIYH